MPRSRKLILFLALAVASLACQTLTRLVRVEPTPTALRPAQLRATPTALIESTPRATASFGPSPTPMTTPTAQPTLAAAFDDLDQFRAAMRPEFSGDVDLFSSVTRYTIDVVVTFNADGSATLTGRERLRYTNQQAFALNDLYLMLWPNDTSTHEYLSRMTLNRVTLESGEVQPGLEHDGLAAHIQLPTPLTPDASVDVSAEFTVVAFPGIDESGAARFGLTNGVLLAPTFYPLIPRIVDGEWQTMPAPPGGDTTNSDTSLYVWRVTAPVADPWSGATGADLAIVGTGSVVASERSGGTQTQTLVTGPMRDLALVVGPLQVTSRTVDGITLNAYMLEKDAEYTQPMLDYAEGQVKTLEADVGPYPFAELDLVDAPGAFGGIEYPGEVFIGVVDGSDFFEVATVHEVGHQWFYSLIGDDQLREPWLDEAAATYTEVLYDENLHGLRAAGGTLDYFWNVLNTSDLPGLPIGLAVADYPSEDDYGAIVYFKGALFFDALRREMGDTTFFAFLHNYFTAYRYRFAASKDFQSVAAQTCTCNLSALFDLWVYKGGLVAKP